MTSTSSFGMRCNGLILLTCTIAPVIPAFTAWSRNTEFSTARDAAFSPNEMFDNPRMIWMSGNASRISLIPSSVHCPSFRSSSFPVATVNVSGSIIRSDCGSPCLSHANATSRRAIASLLSGVFAIPSSSIVSAITAAPNFFARISRSRAASSPSSKLIELMIGLPPCSFSAASSTGVSVLSITSGAFTLLVNRVITSFISAISSRPTNAVQMSRLFDPSATCSRPTDTQPSQSPFSCSSRHFLLPFALHRSPMEK